MSGIDGRALAGALLGGLELLILLRVAVDRLPLRVHGAPTRFIYEASEPLLIPLRPLCRRAATGWRDLSPLLALALLAALHVIIIIY